MMTKAWIKIIVYAVLVAAIITMSALYIESQQHVKTLKRQVEHQNTVIDSLLARRMIVFDVSLSVTDKSRSVIYGRYNKGTITMPQERIYELLIDSSSVNIKRK